MENIIWELFIQKFCTPGKNLNDAIASYLLRPCYKWGVPLLVIYWLYSMHD